MERESILKLKLPRADGTLAPYTLRPETTWPTPPGKTQWSRIAFAAAHVVADPLAAVDPWLTAAIDWDATLAFRRHLWAHGFAVAEAMDTAQRGMGLDWPTSLELIQRSVTEARAIEGAVVFCGAGTDQLQRRQRRHSIKLSPLMTSNAPLSKRWAAASS